MLAKGELDFSELEKGEGWRVLWQTTQNSFIPVVSRFKYSGARLISIVVSFEKNRDTLWDYYFELPEKKCIIRTKRQTAAMDSIVEFFPEAAFLEKEIASNLNLIFS